MSFGFSAGDFVAGANLTYRLIRALSDTRGASIEFQEAIQELGSLQQAFLSVSQMRASSILCQSTINAVSHIVLSSVQLIGEFLERTKRYRQRLCANNGLGSASNSWQKMGWALFGNEELKKLRDALHTRLTSIGTLLSVARLTIKTNGPVAQFQQDSFDAQPTEAIMCRPSIPRMDGVTSKLNPIPELRADLKECEKSLEATEGIQQRSLNSVTPEDASIPAQGTICTEKSSDGGTPGQLDMVSADTAQLEKLLQDLCQQESRLRHEIVKVKKNGVSASGKQKPIKFKDAVGRKFSFPFHLCNTWEGIEDLIKQAFVNVDVIGLHVYEGHYDLVGPNGEIIMPRVWSSVIEPDWTITMHLWPIPESPPESADHNDDETPQPAETMSRASWTSFAYWRPSLFT